MKSPNITLLAKTLGAIVVLLLAGTLVLRLTGATEIDGLDESLFFAMNGVIGSWIISRQPGNRVGWIMLGGALSFSLMTFTGYYALHGLVVGPGTLPAARALSWPQTWLWVPGAALPFLLLPLYFPTGRLLSPRWRWFVRVIVVAASATAIVAAFMPGDEAIQIPADDAQITNPLGIDGMNAMAPDWFRDLLAVMIPILLFGALALATLNLILRFRRSQGVERRQIKWFTYAMAGFPVVILLGQVDLPLGGAQAVFYLTCLPVAIGIAILKYNLYDIDLIIHRTLVYGALSACILTIYVVIVGGLGALVQGRSNLFVALLATGLVAVIFHPLREYLQRGATRLVYGERDEPYAVLVRLGQRLEGTMAPASVLTAIVETIRDALKLPYVAIALQEDGAFRYAVVSGVESSDALHLPLVFQLEPVGELILAPRSPGESFSAADRRLLEDLSRQIGIAAHNVRLAALTMQLNEDLQRSREGLVLTREEERRRIRRELHDGLAPTMAALNLKAGKIRSLVGSEPTAAVELVDEWRTDIRTTIADIRRLAYELRPPVLDELGLVAAIRERADQLSSVDLQIAVEEAENVGALPAAVEVAAYRITHEALANVELHSRARSCRVRFWRECEPRQVLCLEVLDDGIGLPDSPARRSGVGLLSMSERAAELGGSCTAARMTDGGTRILVRLPVVRE